MWVFEWKVCHGKRSMLSVKIVISQSISGDLETIYRAVNIVQIFADVPLQV